MKIIAENKIFVQKNDIAYLNSTDLDIPASIILEVYGKGLTIIDDSNRYEFIKYEQPHEIEFLKNLDFIVDYNEFKDLSENEIIEIAKEIIKKRNELARTFNKMDKNKRKKNINILYECEKLDFKINSIRDIIWFKNGDLNIKLPDETDTIKNEKSLKKIKQKKLFKLKK